MFWVKSLCWTDAWELDTAIPSLSLSLSVSSCRTWRPVIFLAAAVWGLLWTALYLLFLCFCFWLRSILTNRRITMWGRKRIFGQHALLGAIYPRPTVSSFHFQSQAPRVLSTRIAKGPFGNAPFLHGLEDLEKIGSVWVPVYTRAKILVATRRGSSTIEGEGFVVST